MLVEPIAKNSFKNSRLVGKGAVGDTETIHGECEWHAHVPLKVLDHQNTLFRLRPTPFQ